MVDWGRDLASEDAGLVCAALFELQQMKASDPATIDAVAALLRDARVHTKDPGNASGPTYQAVCEEAIATLVAAGPAALDVLERAKTIEHRVTVPVPCHDQGVYIGDYSSRIVVIARAAEDAIRRIGDGHRGSVAWVHMTRSEWLASSDPVTMLKAAFEEKHSTLPDHVRRFLIVCCHRTPHGRIDADLEAAMAIAERLAFVSVTRDVMTAARAAARHSASPIGRTVAFALEADLGLDQTLEALALLDGPANRAALLHELVPFKATDEVEPPLPALRNGSWEPLLEAVLANLDDDVPRLAFATWLAERGDPRGEHIQIQCELARMAIPPPPEGIARFDALRKRDRDLCEHTKEWTRWSDAVIFERGFAERAFWNTSLGNSTLPALRDEPTLREIKAMGMVGGSWLRSLAEMPEARKLRRLFIQDARFSPFELEPLWSSPFFDNLRELELSNCGVDAAVLDRMLEWRGVRRVERLVLGGNGLPKDARARIEKSPWLPALQQLVI